MRFRKNAHGAPAPRITSRSTSPTMPTPRARSRKSASGWRAANCTRWSTTPRSRRRPPAAAGSAPIDTDIDTWSHVFRVNFFAPIMMARGLIEELKAAKGSVVNVTSIAGSRVHPFAGVGLRHLEGGAGLADPRDGVGFRPRRRPRQFDRAGRDRHLDPVAGHREDRRPADPAAPARHARTRWRRSSMCCARRPVPTSTAPRSTSTAASTFSSVIPDARIARSAGIHTHWRS